jgi:hypothetical protein
VVDYWSQVKSVLQRPAFQAFMLSILVLGIHYRFVLEPDALLGAPQSDVIRGVWGLDQQARGLPMPFWTDRIGFPEGVKLVVLPFASSLLAAPLVFSFGAFFAYNLWILLMVLGGALASAALARKLGRSPWGGWIAGGMMATQPMLFLAITDGTPENVAIWSVVVFLYLVASALETGSLKKAALAGLMAAVVALDSPYHALFTIPLLVPLLAMRASGVWTRFKLLLAAVPGVGIGLGAVIGLYYGLPVGSAPSGELANNAVHLQNWIQWEQGTLREPWDWTFAPCFIPVWTLLGTTVLALLNLRRSWIWLFVGGLCLLLALGPSPENPGVLGRLVAESLGSGVGEAAQAFLRFFSDLQAAHPLPIIRFLRRWLIPAALSFALAAELGLARFGRLRGLGPLLGLLFAGISLYLTSYATTLPLTRLPTVKAASFVAEKPEGVVLLLPRTRAATRLQQRNELPVFANLGHELSSASELFIQIATKQPAIYSPTGLLTMVPRQGRTQGLQDFFRDLDDLTLPQTIGNPIPPSATQDPEKRQGVAEALVQAGLRFVVIDEAIFGEVGLQLLRLPFHRCIVEEQHFEDGTGITVLVLEPPVQEE